MAWIRALRPMRVELGRSTLATKSNLDQSALAQHVEDISLSNEDPKSQTEKPSNSQIVKRYPFASPLTPDDELPFIPREEVLALRRPDVLASGDWLRKDIRELWIIIDNVVYRLYHGAPRRTAGHPKLCGRRLLLAILEISRAKYDGAVWQELRVGRTEGVLNRFIEPPRIMGVYSIDDDGW